MNSSSADNMRRKQQRIRQAQEQQRELQERVQAFALNYEFNVQWPATIVAKQTNHDLIQNRLLEAGLMYEVPTPYRDVLLAVTAFKADLERTGCMERVDVELGQAGAPPSKSKRAAPAEPHQTISVTCHEKNWYRLYAGGGVKTDGLLSPEASGGSGMPVAEVDVSLGLRNLSGYLDQTDLQYTLDTHSLATWSLTHERPLYTVLPPSLSYLLLEQATGSQYSLHSKAVLDRVDYDWTRSYQEFQRLLSVRASNQHSIVRPEMSEDAYWGLEWSLLWRDVVPRRHATSPYGFVASPQVVSQAGPSVKHSLMAQMRSNGAYVDNARNPTVGFEYHALAELATPPGDVGFAKCHGGASIHVPVLGEDTLCLHGSLSTGILKNLSFGGLCRPASISDRFFVGGPGSLRGFLPAGIGPRAKAVSGASSPGGDALGGDFYYNATLMASVLPPPLKPWLHPYGLRLFGFCNAGTCVGVLGQTPVKAVLQSTRCSVGMGVSTAALGPRVEATYAWPLWHGPRDARRQFQFGMSFSIG